jgi:hypothetical protein
MHKKVWDFRIFLFHFLNNYINYDYAKFGVIIDCNFNFFIFIRSPI